MTVARLSEDGATVILARGIWSGRFPISDLPTQIQFYRGLRDRGARRPGEPGPYARHYQPTVAALEALWREIQG